jgi:hypothetical protein
VLTHYLLDASKLLRAETSRPCESHVSEPELGHCTVTSDVDMCRLSQLVGIEEEPIRTETILSVGDTVDSTSIDDRSLTVRVQRTDLAAGSDSQATAEKEGRAEVSQRLLAGGGESRRPKGASNPPRARVPWNEVSGPIFRLEGVFLWVFNRVNCQVDVQFRPIEVMRLRPLELQD